MFTDTASFAFRTRKEQKTIPPDRQDFTENDLQTLPELHPPDVMPNGNVGTPTLVFMDFIKQCRLPSSVIKKLGLSFPRTRSQRKYGNVPFDYQANFECADSSEEVEQFATTGSGHVIDTVAVSDDEGNNSSSITKNIKHKISIDDEDNGGISAGLNKKQARLKRKKEKEEMRKLMAENIEEKFIKLQYSPQSGEVGIILYIIKA